MAGGATGSVLSSNDVLRVIPAEMQHNGTVASFATTDTGMPRITLADAMTQRVKWLWAIPASWDALRFDWIAVNEVATTGNVRWRFAYRLSYFGESNVDGAVTTITIPAITAGSQRGFQYNSPSETAAISLPTGFFGDKPFMLCSLARLGADGSDTLAGGISVAAAIGRRVDLP